MAGRCHSIVHQLDLSTNGMRNIATESCNMREVPCSRWRLNPDSLAVATRLTVGLHLLQDVLYGLGCKVRDLGFDSWRYQGSGKECTQPREDN
jgi:hypothetical protein